MKKYLFLFWVLSSAVLLSCNKNKRKQYSTWIVNGQDTFRTNNVDTQTACNPDHSNCSAVLMSNDANNWFSLAFDLDYFPTDGKYIVMYSSQGTPPDGFQICAIKIYYNNEYYYHKSSEYIDTVYASSENTKITYTLPPTWFFNYYNPVNDSIQIQGTFNIP